MRATMRMGLEPGAVVSNLNPRLLFGLTAVFCAALLGNGYYLQFVQHLEPCPMCIFQRLCYAAIVVITIPFALLSSVVALWATGQTINIMTLGGLALAVGILVDEATVAVENIHSHLGRGVPLRRAVLDASGEVVGPRLLAMLAVVAVFVPSFFMTGVSRSLFVPLSLAVGFSMVASFVLSSTLVPVLAAWWLRHTAATAGDGWVDRLRHRLGRVLHRLMPVRALLVPVFILSSLGVTLAVGLTLGREIFPPSGVQAFQLRFRAPTGTRFEKTETLARDVLDVIREQAGPDGVDITLGYVGVHVGFSPGELLDFLLGIVGIDLADDDGFAPEERLRHVEAPREPSSAH